jgi:DNA-binding transcriptional LysR family regulator
MTKIKLHHIRAFVAVAEAGSHVVAARNLRQQQPSVSRAITNLETMLGHKLFEKDRATLTDLGWIMKPRFDQILAHLADVERIAQCHPDTTAASTMGPDQMLTTNGGLDSTS